MPERPLLPERLRPKSIRAKVVTLLTVPVVSLMALWGHAAVTTASQVSATEQLKEINSALIRPISDFTTAVQAERTAAVAYRAAPDAATESALDAAVSRTDKAVTALRSGIGSNTTDIAALDTKLPDRIERLQDSARSLTGTRKSAKNRTAGVDALLARYTTAVERAFAVRTGLAGTERGERIEARSDSRDVIELARAREALSRQDAVLGAAGAAGTMSPAQFRAFVGDVTLQRELTRAAVPDLKPSHADAYRQVLDGESTSRVTEAQDAVLNAGADRAVSAVTAEQWRAGAVPTLSGLTDAERRATAAGTTAEPYSLSTLGSSGLAVILGLVGVVVSLLLSVRIGRGLVTDLTGLRNTALELAATRLPASMRRIHNGEDIDLDQEAPLARTEIRDEVGQVGAALTTVQRAALRAVAGRAAVLTGVSGVYVSLARRSQALLHRQLALLDTMERRTDDPTELEDLFRLDHLTTRMRRHAESLLILSGSAPGRAWRNPVPLIDTVRAGIAEAADIKRVRLEGIPDLRLDGSAVADLVHLVAELTDNAAQFSPPHTPVVVRGEEVGAGAVLEIEDRGLGMGDDALAAANERIRATDVDLLDSRRLGLFVVNRLAQRRNLEVTLRRSVYGGVTALIVIPQHILEAPQPGLRPLPKTDLPEPNRPEQDRPMPNLPAPDLPTPNLPAPNLPVPNPPAPDGPAAPVPAGPRTPAAPDPAPQQRTDTTDKGGREPATEDGLPRRVRQANLAPELRKGDPEPPAPLPARRSPEAARATMASLSSGRRRAHREQPNTTTEGGL
ncbi:nitrate- and nitrite sensing domain-containing protein [Streptomyces sp. NPDC086554]|uniref:sensor histidine kinase n=1 Tax=Streptomyces sp. NPDC086554 TaxID=3154864 RepID=UPI003423ECCC